MARINAEFTEVVLQAGYQNGNFGIVFTGSIVQVKKGRESATDTYTDICVADADIAFNQATANFTLAAGASAMAQAKSLINTMASHGVTAGAPTSNIDGTAW